MRYRFGAALALGLLFAPLANGAIVLVKEVGNTSTFNLTSTFITVPASGVAAGNTILVDVALSITTGAPTVSDSKGNTYSAFPSATNNTNGFMVIGFRAYVNSALVSGDHITITWTGMAVVVAAAAEWSGLTLTTPNDRTAAASGMSTSPSSGSTATTTQANELVMGVIASLGDSASFFPGSGFTGMDSPPVGLLGGVTLTLGREYKIVAATGAYAATGTLPPNESWAAEVATYKGCPDGLGPVVTAPAAVKVTETVCQ
jgi:hypothetical protein